MPTNSKAYTRKYEKEHYAERYAAKKKKFKEWSRARALIKASWKKVPKWYEVGHIKPLSKWWKTTASNIKIQKIKSNRSDGWKIKDKLYNKKK